MVTHPDKEQILYIIIFAIKNHYRLTMYISALAVLLALTVSTSNALPNYHGCASALAKTFQYCDLTLTNEERVASLLNVLTLEEKVGLISPDPSMGNPCFAHIHAIPRVGLPEYGWLVEMNTGVASQCLGPNKCATTFSGCEASNL